MVYIKEVLDAKIVRGLSDVSNHDVVPAKLRKRGRWEFSRNSGIRFITL